MTAIVLPGRPESAAAAREFAAKALAGYPDAADAVAALNELVTNALSIPGRGCPAGRWRSGLRSPRRRSWPRWPTAARSLSRRSPRVMRSPRAAAA